MDSLQEYYGTHFGVPGAPTMESRVKGMSAAFGVSAETKYPIAALPLASQTLIEVDEMPAEATPRQSAAGLLPPGIAMVSFGCRGLPADDRITFDVNEAPYKNTAGVSCRHGAAGEIIEILHFD